MSDLADFPEYEEWLAQAGNEERPFWEYMHEVTDSKDYKLAWWDSWISETEINYLDAHKAKNKTAEWFHKTLLDILKEIRTEVFDDVEFPDTRKLDCLAQAMKKGQ